MKAIKDVIGSHKRSYADMSGNISPGITELPDKIAVPSRG